MGADAGLLDGGRRVALAEQVIELVRHDERVLDVELIGSLANGSQDPYSDIDLVLTLSGVSDRAFAEMLPDFLRPIGPCVVEGWGWTALPESFVRTLYFADYPLFWHVDVRCESDVHVDGLDLKDTYHWPQIFKVWVQELKNVLRGATSVDALDQSAARWMDVDVLPVDVKARLSAHLDLIDARARSRGAPCDELYARCDALRDKYLPSR